jgi:phosphoribosylglycinamide formyltransferase-1
VKLAVFGSGNGSNFEAIVNYFKNKPVEITCISDKEDSYILQRAENLGMKSFYVPFEKTEKFLSKNSFDLIALAGYMRILPKRVLKFGDFINIHPSYLPNYKGISAIERAFNAGESYTGVSIHKVTTKIDSGEIIAQEKVLIYPNDTLNDLVERIHNIEHELYPQIIAKILGVC